MTLTHNVRFALPLTLALFMTSAMQAGSVHAQSARRLGHAGGKLFMVSADMVADRGGRVIC